MTGSLTIKNDKYYAVLNVYEDGKRKKKWICSGLTAKGNKKKAEKFLRDQLALYEQQEGLVSSDALFSEFVRFWLQKISRTVDEITYQGYVSLANSHILPFFDNCKVKLTKVDSMLLQRYIDEKSQTGRKDGKGGLSPRSLRLHMNILHQTLDLAVEKKLIMSNPCQFVDLPKTQRYESMFYSEKELTDLLNAIQGDPMYPIVKITALYGLRRSELLGLQWDSINFEQKTMTVRHTVAKVTKVVAKDKTKNASSFRTFPLTPDALAIFRDAKDQENRNRVLCGKDYQENNYVFKWADGHLYSPDYISHRFNDLLKKHSLPHIRFHELRHSCASMLIALGFTLKDVQEWLGHSDIKMTANIYAHLDTTRKASMADKLSKNVKL